MKGLTIACPKKNERKMTFDITTDVNFDVASSLSLSMAICNHKTCITRIRGPSKIMSPFKGQHLGWWVWHTGIG